MIIAIRLINRKENSPNFQEVISKYGDAIKFRVGISDEPNHGLIILHVEAKKPDMEKLISDLNEVEGISMNTMETPR
ncbi:MAG: hypothetical protein A2Y18_00475 [Clostridiales bacterium GWD2_32_19]|nr:MAG: hypothetical protein A2Y18_00475 [Clostridiales bacterium GWD2_32_19]